MSTSGVDQQEEKATASIPLREWTERALEAVNISAIGNDSFKTSFCTDPNSWPAEIRKSLAVSSDSYLLSIVPRHENRTPWR